MSKVLAEVARYGVDHRNMMSLTPLMLAADAGAVSIVEALLDRGARVDAIDAFGRMPLHFALRRALRDGDFAAEKIGALYELLAPTGVDVLVDGRLVRVARSQGEYFVLAAMIASAHGMYGSHGVRHGGFRSAALDPEVLASFPHSVVPDARRKRAYWNAVLARGEVESTYRPARKLWRRERHGEYLPSATAALRVVDDAGAESYVPIAELLRVPWLDAGCGGAVASR
jgi:hypothetical protein